MMLQGAVGKGSRQWSQFLSGYHSCEKFHGMVASDSLSLLIRKVRIFLELARWVLWEESLASTLTLDSF